MQSKEGTRALLADCIRGPALAPNRPITTAASAGALLDTSFVQTMQLAGAPTQPRKSREHVAPAALHVHIADVPVIPHTAGDLHAPLLRDSGTSLVLWRRFDVVNAQRIVWRRSVWTSMITIGLPIMMLQVFNSLLMAGLGLPVSLDGADRALHIIPLCSVTFNLRVESPSPN